MVVTAEEITGTIGGGHLELQSIEIARDMLATQPDDMRELKRFPLGASLGQCCGGVVNLLFQPIAPEAEWIDQLLPLRRSGKAVAVATMVNRTTPGDLLVTEDAMLGSLGDAQLDRDISIRARDMLAIRAAAQLIRVPVKALRGEALVFIEPVRDTDFRIVLFGAGHVGRSLVSVLSELPCHVIWVDSREHEFPSQVPHNATIVITDDPEAEIAAAAANTYFLVMTHSHALDQTLAESILKRGDFAYFGLIGSVSKRRQFERRLTQRGIPVMRFAGMTCPIGVPGIKSKDPVSIAIAVAAQLLQVRERLLAAAEPVQAAVR